MPFYYAQQQIASRVLGMAWASVCPFVRHTAVLYQNSENYNHQIFTVSWSKTRVDCDKISCPWGRRFDSNDGIK